MITYADVIVDLAMADLAIAQADPASMPGGPKDT